MELQLYLLFNNTILFSIVNTSEISFFKSYSMNIYIHSFLLTTNNVTYRKVSAWTHYACQIFLAKIELPSVKLA